MTTGNDGIMGAELATEHCTYNPSPTAAIKVISRFRSISSQIVYLLSDHLIVIWDWIVILIVIG